MKRFIQMIYIMSLLPFALALLITPIAEAQSVLVLIFFDSQVDFDQQFQQTLSDLLRKKEGEGFKLTLMALGEENTKQAMERYKVREEDFPIVLVLKENPLGVTKLKRLPCKPRDLWWDLWDFLFRKNKPYKNSLPLGAGKQEAKQAFYEIQQILHPSGVGSFLKGIGLVLLISVMLLCFILFCGIIWGLVKWLMARVEGRALRRYRKRRYKGYF